MFEGEESKKCKGVKKSVVKKSIAHEDYKKCLSLHLFLLPLVLVLLLAFYTQYIIPKNITSFKPNTTND